MTDSTDHSPATRSLLDLVERASLFALLQQVMQRQKRPPELPPRLCQDVGGGAEAPPLPEPRTSSESLR